MKTAISPPHHQLGLSLIELMISIAIGLLLTAAMGSLILSTTNSHAELAKLNRQIENGRYAFETVAEDLRHAGNFGMFVPTQLTGNSAPDACTNVAATLLTSLSFPVQGISNYGTGAAEDLRTSLFNSCLPASAIMPNTDVLLIRRSSTVTWTMTSTGATYLVDADGTATATTLTPNQHFLQAGFQVSTKISAVINTPIDPLVTTFNLKKKDAGTGTSTGNPDTYNTPADLHPLLVHIYFVSPCSEEVLDCSGKAQLPTLKRLELLAGTWNLTSIAEGIEQFQVDYGVDPNGSVGTGTVGSFYQCTPTSGSPITYETGCTWQDVVAVRVNVLARNNEPSTGYTDAHTYNLGLWGTKAATNDHYKRHVFSGVVRINSSSMSRECMATSLEAC